MWPGDFDWAVRKLNRRILPIGLFAVVAIVVGYVSCNIDEPATPTADAGLTVCTVERDDDADGIIDGQTRLFFDELGHVVNREFWDEYGERIEIWTNVYDKNGLMVGQRVDRGADGIPDESWTFVHDSDGHMRLSEVLGPDGTVLGRRSHMYDGRGRLVGSRFESLLADSDEQVTYHYDQLGNLVAEDHDRRDDSTVDEIVETTWNRRGQRAVTAHDLDADGAIDLAYHFDYDENGTLQRRWLDIDMDGQADQLWTYSRTDTGELTAVAWDANADGGEDSIVYYQPCVFSTENLPD